MPEAAVQVAEAVSGILDSHVPGLPSEVAQVARVRSAARRILEADLPDDDQDRLLRGLAPRAARAALPMWALEAILGEISHADPADVLLDRPRAARRLRTIGYSECPTCRVPVMDELAVQRAERESIRVQDEREVHDGAVIA